MPHILHVIDDLDWYNTLVKIALLCFAPEKGEYSPLFPGDKEQQNVLKST